ncbi:Nn.00g103720.m01.CDS01 [Neocucurbitaria sp. VM-36]
MAASPHIAIITGSTRPNRISPLVAAWLSKILLSDPQLSELSFSVVDIASFELPIFNEPTSPRLVKDFDMFTNEAAKSWSQEIAKFDAYILVTPEYHQGIPGGLKNAIDYLYHAWTSKSAMILTYGIFGGAQANEQLRRVLGCGMGMKITAVAPMLVFPGHDELKDHTSVALFQAMSGKVSDETWKAWEKQSVLILSGCKELLGLI